MAECKPIRRQIKRVCIGSLRDIFSIHSRNISSPDFGSVDFNEDLPVIHAGVRGLAEQIKPMRMLDGTNIEIDVTHTFTFRFRPNVQAKDIVSFRDQFFTIQRIEDFEDNRLWLKLYCSIRGTTDNEANRA